MKTNSDLDFVKIIELISAFVAQTTCVNCRKFFDLPETAECGHTSCHTCWRYRRSCRACGALIDHGTLKQNVPIQNISYHVRNMCEIFEQTFDIKVDTSSVEHKKSLRNHVSELDNESLYENTIVKQITSTAQVHSHISTKNVVPLPNVIVKQIAQVDWETIEQLHEPDKFNEKQNLDYDPDLTKNVKRCLRRSQRLFSISLSAESADDISPSEMFSSPLQIQHDMIKTISPSTNVFSEEVAKGDWDEIEKFSDTDELNLKHILNSTTDQTKNVTHWLANSDSYFKASMGSELQDIKTVTSTVQIHDDTTTKKISKSPKVASKKVAQDDWNKITILPDADEFCIEQIINSDIDSTKNTTDWLANSEKYSTVAICSESIQNFTNFNLKEVPQNDWNKIEQFTVNVDVNNAVDDINEYSTENPRRSSRKREFKYYAECHYYPLNIKRRRS